MQGLIQRVSQAQVVVDKQVVGKINKGIVLLLGVEKDDDLAKADKLLHKVSGYRIFPDAEGKMNLSLKDIEGDLLIVSQFTLAANTNKGMRPSFSSAATPSLGEQLYNYFVEQAKNTLQHVQTGQFGADMAVHLINDGPVTFQLTV